MDWTKQGDRWIAETTRGTFTIEQRGGAWQPEFVLHLAHSPHERDSETGTWTTLDEAKAIAKRHYESMA